MDPDQTAATGSTLFVSEASNILVDDQKNMIMRFNDFNVSSMCIRLGFSCTHVCAVQKAY